MRVRVYLFTFFGYLMLHVLRTAYSYSKPYFKKQYELTSPFMAVADSTIYFALGLGFLLRPFLMPPTHSLLAFLLTTVLCVGGYLLFPLFSLTHLITLSNAEPIIMLALFLFGFFQLNIWPNFLALVKEHFTNKDDGCLIGLWSAAGDFGNILGFLIPPLFIVQGGLNWEHLMVVVGGLMLLAALGTFGCLERKEGSEQKEAANCSQFWEYIKRACSTLDVALYLMIGCCFKALLYTFLLWLPTYLDDKGEKQLSSQIPVIFNVATIVGSFLVGRLYEDSSLISCKHAHQYVLALLGLVVVGCLVIIVNTTFTPLLFGFMIAIEGFAIGAVFNIIATNETIRLANEDPAELSKLTQLFMAFSNSFIGFVELLVGVSLAGDANTPGSNYDNVFKVLLVLSIFSAALLLTRAVRTYSQPQLDPHIKLADSQ